MTVSTTAQSRLMPCLVRGKGMELETRVFKFHSLLLGEGLKARNLKPRGFKSLPKPLELEPLHL